MPLISLKFRFTLFYFGGEAMSNWEYASKDFVDGLGEADLKRELDEMGEKGWELIVVTSAPTVGWKRYIFKRTHTSD